MKRVYQVLRHKNEDGELFWLYRLDIINGDLMSVRDLITNFIGRDNKSNLSKAGSRRSSDLPNGLLRHKTKITLLRRGKNLIHHGK